MPLTQPVSITTFTVYDLNLFTLSHQYLCLFVHSWCWVVNQDINNFSHHVVTVRINKLISVNEIGINVYISWLYKKYKIHVQFLFLNQFQYTCTKQLPYNSVEIRFFNRKHQETIQAMSENLKKNS